MLRLSSPADGLCLSLSNWYALSAKSEYGKLRLRKDSISAKTSTFALCSFNCSTRERAAVLTGAAELVDDPKLKRQLRRCAQRLETCAATQRVHIRRYQHQASELFHLNRRDCHSRLCPLSEARRAKRLLREAQAWFGWIAGVRPNTVLLFLTLTSKNAPVGNSGTETFDPSRRMLLRHQAALKTFFSSSRLREAILGHLTNIECSFSKSDGQFTVHWHSHSILVVEQAALRDHRYLRQAELVRRWRRALKADYNPIVDIRRLRARTGDATGQDAITAGLREAIKYTLAPGAFVDGVRHDYLCNPRCLLAFYVAAHRRRLMSCGGVVATAKQRVSRDRRAAAKAHQAAAAATALATHPSAYSG